MASQNYVDVAIQRTIETLTRIADELTEINKAMRKANELAERMVAVAESGKYDA